MASSAQRLGRVPGPCSEPAIYARYIQGWLDRDRDDPHPFELLMSEPKCWSLGRGDRCGRKYGRGTWLCHKDIPLCTRPGPKAKGSSLETLKLAMLLARL